MQCQVLLAVIARTRGEVHTMLARSTEALTTATRHGWPALNLVSHSDLDDSPTPHCCAPTHPKPNTSPPKDSPHTPAC